MPDFPTGKETGYERGLLEQFVEATREFLLGLVTNGTDSRGTFLFVDDLFPLLKEAWPGVDAHFQAAIEKIPKIEDEQLDRHALRGPQLQLKLRIVSYFAERFRQVGGLQLLFRLIDAIEALLDSILDAASVGGAIKEYKQGVKNATKGPEGG